jgi:hypothetical protein
MAMRKVFMGQGTSSSEFTTVSGGSGTTPCPAAAAPLLGDGLRWWRSLRRGVRDGVELLELDGVAVVELEPVELLQDEGTQGLELGECEIFEEDGVQGSEPGRIFTEGLRAPSTPLKEPDVVVEEDDRG